MSNQKKGSGCAVVLMIFFFPFALLYLLYVLVKKLGSEPQNYKKNSKTANVAACILIALGIIYLVAGMTGQIQSEDPDEIRFGVITMLIVCCGGGLALLLYNLKCKKFAVLYNKYVPCILGSQTDSIDQLASMVGVPYDTALADLDRLIGHSELKGAYIDRQNGKLIMPKVEEPPTPMVQVTCPHCGGTNSVPEGESAACDYCGMPLE